MKKMQFSIRGTTTITEPVLPSEQDITDLLGEVGNEPEHLYIGPTKADGEWVQALCGAVREVCDSQPFRPGDPNVCKACMTVARAKGFRV